MSYTESDILAIKAQSEKYYFGDPQRALELAQQAYEIGKCIGTSHARALGHWALANAYLFSDDLERVRQAAEFFEKADGLFDAQIDAHERARMQIGYIFALAQLDETERALEVASEAESVLADFGDLEGLAKLLSNIGIAHELQGNFEKALAIYDQRLLALEVLPQQQAKIGRTHINRAVAFLCLNDYAEAEAALELARVGLMPDSDGNAVDLAKLELNIGIARVAQHQHQAAVIAFEQALKWLEPLADMQAQIELVQLYLALASIRTGLPERVAEGYTSLAQLMPALGRSGQGYEQGLVLLGLAEASLQTKLWQPAREAVQKVLLLASSREARALRVPAHVLLAQIAAQIGDLDEAIATLKRAIADLEAQENEVRDEALRASWLSDKLSAYHHLIRLLLAQGESAAALEIAQHAKARELRRSIESEVHSVSHRVRPSHPELADEIEHLQAEIGRLKRQSRLAKWQNTELGLSQAAADAAAEDIEAVALDSLEERRRKKLAEAQQSLPQLTTHFQAWSSRELANHLAPNELLIEYVWGEHCIWAWAIRQSGVVAQRVISDLPTVNALCDSYAQAIQRALGLFSHPLAGRFAASLLKDVDSLGQKLYAALILPFGALVSPDMVDTLVIAADGKLNRLPFHALPQPDGTPMLQTYEVRYVPGAAFARPLMKHRRTYALGISGAAEHATQARRELDALLLCFGESTRFDDAAIDLEQLKAEMKTHNWIHLATHAAMHLRNPHLSTFALGARDVTLAEVADFELHEACVILSACETGLGHHKGSDIFSLARAFMGVGATTLVTSLWRVAEVVTAQLMDLFYQNLAQGQRLSQALRHAQLSVRQHVDSPLHLHPAIWAPMLTFGADVLPARRGD